MKFLPEILDPPKTFWMTAHRAGRYYFEENGRETSLTTYFRRELDIIHFLKLHIKLYYFDEYIKMEIDKYGDRSRTSTHQ